jgi:hypothetical protein
MARTPRFWEKEYLAALIKDASAYVSPVEARNVVGNSNFDTWQRGITGTITVNDTAQFVADRWYTRFEGTQTGSIVTEQSTDVPNASSRFSMRVRVGTGNITSTIQFHARQVIEKQFLRPLVSNPNGYTISFWYKSNRTGSHAFAAVPAANAFVGYANFVASFQVKSPNTWEFKTVFVPYQTVTEGSASATDAGLLINIGFYALGGITTAAAGDYFQLSQVMLNEGPTAAPFAPFGGSHQADLAHCHRYYHAMSGAWSLAGPTAGSNIRIPIKFPVSMRAAPTMTISTGGFSTGINDASTTAQSISTEGFSISMAAGSNNWSTQFAYTAHADF